MPASRIHSLTKGDRATSSRSSLQTYVIELECERPRPGSGRPDDSHDVAAIQVAKTGEGQGKLLPLGCGYEGLRRGPISQALGEDHDLIGLAVTLGPELDGLSRGKIDRRHRCWAGRKHHAGPGVRKTWRHFSRHSQSMLAAFGPAGHHLQFRNRLAAGHLVGGEYPAGAEPRLWRP